MEKILEFGGAHKCSLDQEVAFANQVQALATLLAAQPLDAGAIKKALKDLGTLTIDLEGSNAPGFFQRLEAKCVLSLKDIINLPPTPSAPSVFSKTLRSSASSSELPPVIKLLADNDLISLSQGEIKTDWIRIGLSAGVLFLLVVVLLLLMRKPQTEYLR
jgi:hypothetical protein